MKTLKEICEALVKGNASESSAFILYKFDSNANDASEGRAILIKNKEQVKQIKQLNIYPNSSINDIMEDMEKSTILLIYPCMVEGCTDIDWWICSSKQEYEDLIKKDFIKTNEHITLKNFNPEYWKKNNWYMP